MWWLLLQLRRSLFRNALGRSTNRWSMKYVYIHCLTYEWDAIRSKKPPTLGTKNYSRLWKQSVSFCFISSLTSTNNSVEYAYIHLHSYAFPAICCALSLPLLLKNSLKKNHFLKIHLRIKTLFVEHWTSFSLILFMESVYFYDFSKSKLSQFISFKS